MHAVAGSDNPVTLWDLSVEADGAPLTTKSGPKTLPGQPEIPSQLLFIHQGQENIKETHWHSQITGLVISAAETGLNIFKSISVPT